MTPILNTMYFSLQDSCPDYFISQTNAMRQMEEQIEKMIEERVSFSEKFDLLDKMYDYANENEKIGFINGFRVCAELLKELHHTGDKNFMTEILTEGISPYWEYELNKQNTEVTKDVEKENGMDSDGMAKRRGRRRGVVELVKPE